MKKLSSGCLLDGIAVFAAAAGIMVMRFMLGRGDVCHPESCAFLQVYTETGKSLLQIIYNPWYTDWDCYQARELSYLLDWCDVQIIKASILAGHAHFFSVVNAVSIVAAAMVLHYGFRRWMPKLGRWGAALLALLFVAAPSCVSGCVYFRSSKPAVSLGIAIAGIAVWSIFLRRKEPISSQRGAWIALGISLLLMPYLDRQGMFFVSVFALACGAFIFFLSLKSISEFFVVADTDRRRLAALMLIAAGSTALATFYNLVIAPCLIHHLNGYYPSFWYQNMGRVYSIFSIFRFSGGLTFFLDNVGFTISRWNEFGTIVIGASAVFLWLLLCCIFAKRRREGWLLLITVAGSLSAMIVSSNIMVTRHCAMLMPDVIHGGYFLPIFTGLILLLAISIQVMGRETNRRLQIGISICAALIIGIHCFSELTTQREAEGHQDIYIANSPELIRCLNDPARDPEKTLMPYSYLQLIRYFHAMNK